MSNNKNDQRQDNCLNCNYIREYVPCLDFYRNSENGKGGELYFFQSRSDSRDIIPCQFSALLFTLCQMLKGIAENEILSLALFCQCIRDLRTASFLILTGHYRNAMQIMRPVIENWLTGLYWDLKITDSDEENIKNIIEEYNKFLDQSNYKVIEEDWIFAMNNTEEKRYLKRDLNHEFLTNWLKKKEFIPGKFKNFVQKKIGILNKFLHPVFNKTDIVNFECSSCHAEMFFDKTNYEECVEIFQDICAFLLGTFWLYLVTYYPEKIKELVKYEIFDTLNILCNSKGKPDKKAVFSRELRNFIKKLKMETKLKGL